MKTTQFEVRWETIQECDVVSPEIEVYINYINIKTSLFNLLRSFNVLVLTTCDYKTLILKILLNLYDMNVQGAYKLKRMSDLPKEFG